MPYNPAQPRVPAGTPAGGQWTDGTFFHDAGQWTHPGTGQKRIYLNNHDAGQGNKVWIEEGEYAGMKWQANMKQEGWGSTSAASIRAGSNNPRDIAAEAANSLVGKHGINARAASFGDLWKMARPEKLKRTEWDKLDAKIRAKFINTGGRLYD